MAIIFDHIWQKIQRQLSPGQTIPNWSAQRGLLGDSMTVVEISKTEIIIDAPNAKKPVHVSRNEFEKIWEVWPSYKAGQVKRQEICEFTFYSKYTISVLNWLEENKNL